MELTYNGLKDSKNLVTFSDVPNIIEVKDNVVGTKASLVITFNASAWMSLYTQVNKDGQFYFTFLGETITNTMDINMARNKQFYIANTAISTAYFFAQALRNCSTIAVDFNVIQLGTVINVEAKTIGARFSKLTADMLVTNIPNMVMTYRTNEGSVISSAIYGGRVNVDLYKSGEKSDDYLCTLTKFFSGDKCAFDISPITSTISEYGKTTPYYANVFSITSGGDYINIGTISGDTTVGYEVNMSERFLYNGYPMILACLNRNDEDLKLYTYSNEIDYSFLFNKKEEVGFTTNGKLTVYDSASNVIYTEDFDLMVNMNDYIYDRKLTVPEHIFHQAYKVNINLGTVANVTYDVIKPLRAAEEYQRVLWRNEYGGISFFDFTSQRSESDTVDIETYEKNILDYYDSYDYESKRIYSLDYSKEVTLSSHLMEKEGTYIFNSLMNSRRIWTVINGRTYYIIPKSIEVNEEEQYDNIFRCRFKYTYSHLK